MKTILTLLLLACVYVSVVGQETEKAPKMKLELTFNGQSHQITDGDTISVDGNEIIIKTLDYLTFDKGVVKFSYPKYFAYEFEEDYAFKNWTLNGSDFVIMYFELGVYTELDALTGEMVKSFGVDNCKVEEKKTKIGEIELSGKRIDVEILGQKLTYDLYRLESNDAKSHFIAFQDSKKENGGDSNEYREGLKILNKTLIYK